LAGDNTKGIVLFFYLLNARETPRVTDLVLRDCKLKIIRNSGLVRLGSLNTDLRITIPLLIRSHHISELH
jgi:hypothetical protein